MVTRRLFILGVVLALGGCSLGKQNAPALAGPSEFALSLAITATPDTITWDGVSQSVIGVLARDASGQPVSGLSLRLETEVAGVPADFGTLSSKTISTGADGRGSVTYIAPPTVPNAPSDAVVDIVATPVGTNYGNETPRFISIKLARPGVIVPPSNDAGLTVGITFSPSKPAENQDVFFTGSASFADTTPPSPPDYPIVSWQWDFGDGSSGSGQTVHHAYALAGTYQVILTVTDSQGASAQSDPENYGSVEVAAAADLTAAFIVSPADATDDSKGVPAGTTVYFNGQGSTAPPGRTIVKWEWDFGDGKSATGEKAQHVYTDAGGYAVVLRVTDDTGRTKVSDPQTVIVK